MHNGFNNFSGQNAFLVIGADNSIHSRDNLVDILNQLLFSFFSDRAVIFLINPQNLLVMGNDPYFGSGGPVNEPKNSFGLNRPVMDGL